MQTRFVYRDMPLFYQQYNARDIENSKPTGHRMTTDLASAYIGRFWQPPLEARVSLKVKTVLCFSGWTFGKVCSACVRHWTFFLTKRENQRQSEADSVSVTQWPFPIQDFPVTTSLLCLCWLWYVLMPYFRIFLIICVLRWYVGRRRSVSMLAVSSVVAGVGKSSIRAAICIRCLGCLDVEKSI